MPTRVRELTGGEGVTTVFDTVGKDTFEGSLKSLKRRGVLVGVRHRLRARSRRSTRSSWRSRARSISRARRWPTIIADPAERAELSGALFDHVASGRIKIEINQRYALEDAVQAHRDLEAGKTTGSSIFVI